MIFRKTQQNTDLIKTEKKPARFGWWWLFWVSIYANIFFGKGSRNFSDSGFADTNMALVFLSPIIYFKFRSEFIKKWEFNRFKHEFAAGICTLLVLIIASGCLHYFDAKSVGDKVRSLNAKYKDQGNFYTQEDSKYLSRIITNPKSIASNKENIKAIDALLAHLEKKQVFLNGMFNDWKATLQGMRNKKLNKPWSDVVEQMSSLSAKSYDKQKRAWELLKKHYSTGNDKYYQEYTATYQEAEGLDKQLKQLFKAAY